MMNSIIVRCMVMACTGAALWFWVDNWLLGIIGLYLLYRGVRALHVLAMIGKAMEARDVHE